MGKMRTRMVAALLLLAVMAGSLSGCYARDIPVAPMVEGDTNLTNLVLSGDLTIGDDLTLGDDLAISGDLDVAGSSELDGGITVDDTAFIVADTSGNTTVGGTLAVTGITTVTGALIGSATLDITGGVSELDGGITVDDTAFVVGDTTGNITTTGALEVGGVIEYGTDDLNPVGFASSGQQLVYGSSLLTTSGTLTHGLTTVTFCMAMLGEDPTSAGTTAAYVTIVVAGNVCTAKVWQDDMVTASDEADVDVIWFAVGAP